jgi:hypothetical protein
MAFWLSVLGGSLFVWVAVRRGFFETWGLLFNSLVSIYLAIFLAPYVAMHASTTGTISPYSTVLSMLVLGGGCFAVLYGLSYVFLTGQFRVSFPDAVDILLAGPLGFLTGFLIFSFAALIIAAAPLPKNGLLESMGLAPPLQGPSMSCIAWCGDRVHAMVGRDPYHCPTRRAIERLFESPRETTAPRASQPVDPNEPVVPTPP